MTGHTRKASVWEVERSWKWNFRRKKMKRKEKKNIAVNSERNFLWCQSWQMKRKRNLRETLVFDGKRREGWWSGRTSRRRKIYWEIVEWTKEKEGVWVCAWRKVNVSTSQAEPITTVGCLFLTCWANLIEAKHLKSSGNVADPPPVQYTQKPQQPFTQPLSFIALCSFQ